jgi:hypothetical protein
MFTSRTRRTAGWLLAVASCSLALTACGGEESSGGTSGASETEASSNEQDTARVRLQECLRENGVDIPDGPPGEGGGGAPGDIDRDALEEAMKACEEYQDEAFGNLEGNRQEIEDSFAKFSQCMRDEGIDVPEINFGEGGGPPADGEQLDRDDPDVQAALEKCQDEMPQGGPGAGGAP